jgi:hypothetical protein
MDKYSHSYKISQGYSIELTNYRAPTKRHEYMIHVLSKTDRDSRLTVAIPSARKVRA